MLTDIDIAQIRAVVSEELARARRRPLPAPRPRPPLPALAPLLDGCDIITAREAADLAAPAGLSGQTRLNRAAAALVQLGWTHERRQVDGRRIWRYHRPGT